METLPKMKYILVKNTNPPFNLRRISPNWALLEELGTEDAVIQQVIARNKEVGVIPCETRSERARCVKKFLANNSQFTDADFPTIGLHWVVDESDLPGGIVNEENDYFFDCWEWDNGCKVNMPRARVIHMDHIRKVRNVEFEKRGLDRHLQTALAHGDTVRAQELEDEKQTLRDIPQKYDLSVFKTPEKLKAFWPKELDERIKEVKKAL